MSNILILGFCAVVFFISFPLSKSLGKRTKIIFRTMMILEATLLSFFVFLSIALT